MIWPSVHRSAKSLVHEYIQWTKAALAGHVYKLSVLMVTILAKKIYSDEEIGRLRNNPFVLYVSRHRLSLKLDFKQKLYDEWLINPLPLTLERLLEDNGFDVRELGSVYCQNMSKAFKKWGRPQRAYGASVGSEIENPYLPEHERKPVEENTLRDIPVLNGQDKDKKQISDRDVLIQSGKFILEGNTIYFTQDYCKELYSRYPQKSVLDSIADDGFSVLEIGRERIRTLEKVFRTERKAGTAPYESREKGNCLKEDELAAVRKNPFVKTASPEAIELTDGFYIAAAALRELPVDHILDTFLLGHRNFMLPEKSRIKERLELSSYEKTGDSIFGGSIYDACILRRRMTLLEEIVKEGCRRLSGLYISLEPHQKKHICSWIESLPSDPGNVFTKKEILRQTGITRSVYYQYIKDPDFGMGKIRKAEQDEKNARLVKMVFDYKHFRKGSRQIYMLLPRITKVSLSLKKIRRIMKAYGLESGIREKNPVRIGQRSLDKKNIKPNLLRRKFRLFRPNRVRVTDVTYLDYGDEKRAYGSALMDPVTGRLLAFVISEKNNLELALETLRVSDNHPCEDGGIFHSDQGVLYRSGDFQKEILERGLEQSMSKKGNCWDNATQESFFGHFKDECDYKSCPDIEALKKEVEKFSWYYNNERGMWDRGRMTPVEYEEYLLGLSDEEYEEYLAAEEKRYNEMKKKAAELAKKRYGTLGV